MKAIMVLVSVLFFLGGAFTAAFADDVVNVSEPQTDQSSQQFQFQPGQFGSSGDFTGFRFQGGGLTGDGMGLLGQGYQEGAGSGFGGYSGEGNPNVPVDENGNPICIRLTDGELPEGFGPPVDENGDPILGHRFMTGEQPLDGTGFQNQASGNAGTSGGFGGYGGEGNPSCPLLSDGTGADQPSQGNAASYGGPSTSGNGSQGQNGQGVSAIQRKLKMY